jgi:Uncharacterized conserved protein (DUF2203)
MLHRRHYSLEDANETLGIVGRTVRDLRHASRRMAAHGPDPELALEAETTGGAWPGRDRAAAAVTLSLGFERLEQLDVVVRDLERGIVDFPTVMVGREVYLCWQVDEPEVTHWHGLESGFASRRPVGRPARRT